LIAVLASLLIYVGLRCYLLSITHDEALTYLWHVRGAWLDIVLFRTPGLPDNNHLLFTLLAKLCTLAFGGSEFALRLPSLASFAAYLVSVWLILRRFAGEIVAVFATILAAGNPYIVDMMSVARGYGLGIALSVIGLYFSVRSLDVEAPAHRPSWDNGIAATAFALAALTNLSFLLLYVANALMSLVLAWLSQSSDPLSRLRAVFRHALPMLPSLALLGVLIIPIRAFQRQGLLQTESAPSFFEGTVKTLVSGSLRLGAPDSWVVDVSGLAACVLMIFAFGLSIYGMRNHAPRAIRLLKCKALFFMSGLVLVVSVLSILQHHLLGVSYLSGRRAVFFIPAFFVVSVLLLVNADLLGALAQRLLAWSAAAAGVALLVLSLSAMNLDYIRDWRYDSYSKEAMMRLQDEVRERGLADGSKSMGIDWVFEPSLNYYRERLKMNWLAPLDRSGPAGRHDFYYVFKSEWPNLARQVGAFHVIGEDDGAGTILVAAAPLQPGQ
jgi:uncharacterized membrane protein